jgi:hypothetical protein
MRSIERRFKKEQSKTDNINSSSYIIFGRTIADQGFSKKQITKWFNILVEKDDYLKEEKKELIRQLVDRSYTLEEGSK